MRFDHFEFLAPIYDSAIPARLAPQLLNLLDPRPGMTLLDAAGGTGRLALPLKDIVARVVVADLAAGMLRRAQAKHGLLPVRSSTSALPFPDAAFDRVLMVDALHHIQDRPAAVREMARVLRPGGIALIQEPDIDTFAVKVVALIETLAGMGSRFLSLEGIAALHDGLSGRVFTHRQDYTLWVGLRKS